MISSSQLSDVLVGSARIQSLAWSTIRCIKGWRRSATVMLWTAVQGAI